ncbi:alpha/beta hydrolase [Streptosporangium canum]|uniref:alpha/beta fold hydrolase n=1 Tax=Streptosporangium canum TaxID=324952 RepID=UPI0034303496
MTQETDQQPRPRRRWARRTLTVLVTFLTLAVTATLLVAYVWQPPEAHGSRTSQLSDPRYVDTAVGRFHYSRTGEGPPIVLLPGGTLWIHTYRDTIPALAGDHTVYAVDLPGNGYTTVHDDDFAYDLQAMTGALTEFMDAVGVPRASIVAHSLNGAVALSFAQQHPDWVDRIALMAPLALDAPLNLNLRLMRIPVIGEATTKLMTEDLFVSGLSAAYVHRERFTPETAHTYWAPLSRADNRKAMWKQVRNLDLSLVDRHLGQISAPTLVLWGERDTVVAPWQAGVLGRRIPGSTVRVIPGAGHNVHEDDPAAVNAHLAAFLDPAPEPVHPVGQGAAEHPLPAANAR